MSRGRRNGEPRRPPRSPCRADGAMAEPAARRRAPRCPRRRRPARPAPGATRRRRRRRPDAPVPTPAPDLGDVRAARATATAARRRAARRPSAVRPARDPDDVTDAVGLAARPSDTIEYVAAAGHELLDDVGDRRSTPAATRTSSTRGTRRSSSRSWPSFGIPARIVGRNAGPVVTQYEVQPAPRHQGQPDRGACPTTWRWRSPPARSGSRRRSRARARSASRSRTRTSTSSPLRRILEEVDFTASGSTLTFALGRDVAGKAQAVDLAKMPHLLIAGATGSGKSVMVNALITSLLCKATPDDVRMILMDLKRVELAAYNGLPHLLVPVITEPERAKAALKWAVNEMEDRYRRFAGATARNIRAFNDTRVDPDDRMPYIVIIIDELADLMMREGKNVEDPIVRLAQKARATGIHMVLATQRPSVNVVTGLIKANFPSRIAFAMASQIDSRTILDAPGAEDLIGRGDMLYQPSDLPRPMRLQGVFVSDPEIGRVVDHWKATRSTTRTTTWRSSTPATRSDGLRRRPHRRGRRSAAARCHRRHPGVRSCLGVAPPAAPEGRLRAGGPDDRPARGARLHRGVRRVECPAGPPPRRRPGRRPSRRGRRGTTDDDAGAAQAGSRGRPVRRRPRRRHRAGPDACPSGCYAARERKGVDLYRAERDTKIRARYLGALERGDYTELPGRRLHQGLPAQLRALPRPRPGRRPPPVAARARRRRRSPPSRPSSCRKPIAAPRQGLTFSPGIVVAALLTVVIVAFGGLPRRPAAALREAADDRRHRAGDRGHRRRRGHDARTRSRARRSPGATVSIATPGRGPATGSRPTPTGTGPPTSTCAAAATSSTISALDPDTGKQSGQAPRSVFITVPFLVDRGADADRRLSRPTGRQFENGAIPVDGHRRRTRRPSSVIGRLHRPVRAHRPAAGARRRPPASADRRPDDRHGRRRRHVQRAARADRRACGRSPSPRPRPEGKTTSR